jgi:hypothetical protein
MSGFPVASSKVFSEVFERFETDERALLEAITLTGSPESSFHLLSSLATWGWKVRVFAGQLERSAMEPDPKVWGADDLAGTLFDRDRVENMLARVPEALAERVRGVVDEFDAEYRAFTVDDAQDEITRVGRVSHERNGWWWHRIPDRGPVREELDTLAIYPNGLDYEMRLRFTDDEQAVLDTIAEGDSTQEKSRLVNSISSWGSGVRIVAWQLSGARPLPYLKIGGVQDLIGALRMRDRVQALLAEVPESLAGKVSDALGEFDEQYRAITADDHDDRMGPLRPVSGDRESWWWHRIPVDGPVRAELDMIDPSREETAVNTLDSTPLRRHMHSAQDSKSDWPQ